MLNMLYSLLGVPRKNTFFFAFSAFHIDDMLLRRLLRPSAIQCARNRYLSGTAATTYGQHGGSIPTTSPIISASPDTNTNTSSMMAMVPMVLEKSARGERVFDIYSRLLKEHIIMLNGPINDSVSSVVVAQLLFLEAEDPTREISLYINSPGGVVTSGMAIFDTMNYVAPPISTMCIGQACSMASLLLAAGTPGMRRALPNSRVMIHQPSGGTSGQASDIAIHAKEILELRSRLAGIYSRVTGQEVDEIESKIERDCFMSAAEAQKFGIVDHVVEPRKVDVAQAA